MRFKLVEEFNTVVDIKRELLGFLSVSEWEEFRDENRLIYKAQYIPQESEVDNLIELIISEGFKVVPSKNKDYLVYEKSGIMIILLVEDDEVMIVINGGCNEPTK